MGTATTTIEVGDPQGRNFRSIEVEVDTGSTYTALPRGMLQALGVPVTRTVASRLADGSEKPVQVGYANIKLAGAELITPVIFAEDGEPSPLGVISLEDALLAVDCVPWTRQTMPHPSSTRPPEGTGDSPANRPRHPANRPL